MLYKLWALAIFFSLPLQGESCPFADLSFLVVDLKYSQECGIKICEVQHAALSFFEADPFLNGEKGSISPLFAQFCTQFSPQKWVAHIAFPPLGQALGNRGWRLVKSIEAMEQDEEFLACGATLPSDPSAIETYAAIAYCSPALAKQSAHLYLKYPGVLFFDRIAMPYWIDKYKMNLLFERQERLCQAKAEWKLYPKIYQKELAQEIKAALPASRYVIKPRSGFSGHGVLIVPQEDLDKTLKLILSPGKALRHHKDSAYGYWSQDTSDSFLIEKYYPSDPLVLEQKPSFSRAKNNSLSNKKLASSYTYDPTLRFFIALSYNRSITCSLSLGCYWQLPRRAFEERGSLNEQTKSLGEIPYYVAANHDFIASITPEIEEIMRLLYEEMLADWNRFKPN